MSTRSVPGEGNAPRPSLSCGVLGALFVAAGINHFVMPAAYRPIVPPGFGDPATVVAVSGVAEIAGGVGALVPATRRAAGWGLVALLAAVFPANVYMAVRAERFRDLGVPPALLWLRLPLQPLMMWWALRATRPAR